MLKKIKNKINDIKYTRSYNYYLSNKKWLQLLVLPVLVIGLFAGTWGLKNYRLFSPKATGVKVYLVPTSAVLRSGTEASFDVMVDSDINSVSGVHVEIPFNNANLNLSREITLGQGLGQTLKVSTMAEANTSGKIVIARGLNIANKSNPPKGVFLLATVWLRPSTTSTLTSTITPEAVKISDMSSSLLSQVGVIGSTININPVITTTVTTSLTPTGTPTPKVTSPTPGSGTGIKVMPTEDTYVDSANPNTNFGSSNVVYVDGSPVVITFMKFDLINVVSTVAKAELNLYVTNLSAGLQNVKNVGTNWSENTLNYGNMPVLGSLINSFSSPTVNTWVRIDITSFVNANKGKVVGLGIDTSASDGTMYSSKDSGTNAPYLLVQTLN